jgi:hypothetical protein
VSHFDGLRVFLRESEKIPLGWAGFVVVGWCRDGQPKFQSVLRELRQIWRRLFCAGGLAGWGRVAGAVWRVAGSRPTTAAGVGSIGKQCQCCVVCTVTGQRGCRGNTSLGTGVSSCQRQLAAATAGGQSGIFWL